MDKVETKKILITEKAPKRRRNQYLQSLYLIYSRKRIHQIDTSFPKRCRRTTGQLKTDLSSTTKAPMYIHRTLFYVANKMGSILVFFFF
jgi:hypothetical protein